MAARIHNGACAPGLAAPERAHVHHAGLASLGAPDAAAAGLAHQKDKAPRLAGAEGPKDQTKVDDHECAKAYADSKRFATLHARLALASWALSRSDPEDGPVALFVSRWKMPLELASLDAVAAFADLEGALK